MYSMRTTVIILTFAALLLATDIEHEFGPIRYQSTPPRDAAGRLDAALTYERSGRGYLTSLLDELDIPVSSQVLVFSRTSIQGQYIHPDKPRAIYFNDHAYVAWVPGAPLLEVCAFDPQQGAMFYTVVQDAETQPRLTREVGDCLRCHASDQTQGVSGVMVLSADVDEDGNPKAADRGETIDHRTPIADRWSGWYVSGDAGAIGRGRTLADLDTSPYLTPRSDMAALLVLEHQTQMHNLIIRAGWHTRMALQRRGAVNEDGTLSRRAQQRIARDGEGLLRYLLFCGEAELPSPVARTAFVDAFTARAKRDGQGRSLRDMDLESRLFTYRCSYMIHSDAFAALPHPMKSYVLGRLNEILTGRDASDDFAHLGADERQAILEMLRETL